MQTQDKCGIICDFCGITFKEDFVYYSWEFRFAQAQNNRKPPLNTILATQPCFSMDVCPNCWDVRKNQIIHNYSKVNRVGTLCELSGFNMTGTYNFYYVEVVKADVNTSSQPNVCIKCNKETIENQQCPCGGTEFIRVADIQCDYRHVEFCVSEPTYTELKSLLEKTKQNIGKNWTTK